MSVGPWPLPSISLPMCHSSIDVINSIVEEEFMKQEYPTRCGAKCFRGEQCSGPLPHQGATISPLTHLHNLRKDKRATTQTLRVTCTDSA
jgi:hypothetical protein